MALFVPVIALIAGACTYDFAAPFSEAEGEVGGRTPKADSGTSGNPVGDGTCKFTDDDYGLAAPRSWFRLDETSGDFKAQPGGVPELGFRKENVVAIDRGALRSPNKAQYLANSQIGFGDAWRDFTGKTENNTAPLLALELWFRLRSLNGTQTQTLFGKLSSEGTSGYHVKIFGGSLKFERFGAAQLLAHDMGIAAPGSWHHLVLQIDDRQITSFLDGQKRSTDTTNGSVTNAGGGFLLGPFDGDVDELASYGRLLAEDEVLAHLDAVTSNSCKGGATTVCFGPQARGTCSNGRPRWTANCNPDEACVMNEGRSSCVPDTCPKK